MKKTWIRKTLSVGVLAAGALLLGPAAMAQADNRGGDAAPKTESLHSSQNLLGNGALGNAAHKLAHGGFGGAQSQVSPGLGHGFSNMGHGFSNAGKSFSHTGTRAPSFGHVMPSVGHLSPSLGHTSPTFGHASSSLGHTSPTFGHTSPTLGHTSPTWGHISPGLGNGTRTFTHTQTHTGGSDHWTPGIAGLAHQLAHGGHTSGGQMSGGQMSGGHMSGVQLSAGHQSGGEWDDMHSAGLGSLGHLNGASTAVAADGPVNICGNSLSFLSHSYTQATCSNSISGDTTNVHNVRNVKPGQGQGQAPADAGDVAGDKDGYPSKDDAGDVRGDTGYDAGGEAPDTAGYGDEAPDTADAGQEMPTGGEEPAGAAMDDDGYGGELPDQYSGDKGGRGGANEKTTVNKVANSGLGFLNFLR